MAIRKPTSIHTSIYVANELPQAAQLRATLKQLQSQQRFVQAQEVSIKLHQLLTESHGHHLSSIHTEHRSKQAQINQEYNTALQQFESKWEKAIAAFKQRCQLEMKDLLGSQSKGIHQHRNSLDGSLSPKAKPSSFLLQLIKCKQKAVQCRNYIDAQAYRQQIDQTVKSEQRSYQIERNQKIQQQLRNLRQLQARQTERLEITQKKALDELLRQKIQDYDRLQFKYQNIRNAFKNGQKIEKNKANGLHTTSAGRHQGSVPNVPIPTKSREVGWRTMYNENHSPTKKYLNLSL